MSPTGRLLRSPRDAELVACEWMRHWGFVDATCTAIGPDSGIDIASSTAIAQVKAELTPTGRPVVQQTFGAAAASERVAIVFSLGGFTKEAIQWANLAGVALFTFDLQGTPAPENDTATTVSRGTDI